MSLNWIDVSDLSFNHLLLLERAQIGWLTQWEETRWQKLATALKGNPAVEWTFRHRCPEINPWLDRVMKHAAENASSNEVRQAEIAVMEMMNDWIVYIVEPSIYENLPFLAWDAHELTSLVDFSGKTVVDIGSGTGKQAFIAAEKARTVYCVEPVGNLRKYICEKAGRLGVKNVYAVDGMITEIPFPEEFADVVTCGHVFGDEREKELKEMLRVVKPDGMVILIPGSSLREMPAHNYLVENGFSWAEFIEPPDDVVRKYWKTKET